MRSVLFSLILFVVPAPAITLASNYPPSYSWQTVYAFSDGPVVVAKVSSGVGTHFILGYKKNGYLASLRPAFVDAILTSSCRTFDGSFATKTDVIKLGPEWHGTGYMSAAFYITQYIPENCRYDSTDRKLEVAFSDGHDHWDSRYRNNYVITDSRFAEENGGVRFETKEPGAYGMNEPNLKAWDFIVGQMR